MGIEWAPVRQVDWQWKVGESEWILQLIITITISSNVMSALPTLFFTNHSVQLLSDRWLWMDTCNRAVKEANHTFQPNPPITELITITTTKPLILKKKTLWNFQNRGMFYFRYRLYRRYLSKMYLLFSGIVTVMINC